MKLVAAQIRSMAGDIDANIERHARFIERAAFHGGAAVCFPELSLTGYEPRMAQRLAMAPDDSRLDVFQALSNRHRLLIAVGAPYRGRHGTEIGMFVFRCRKTPAVYAKQILHDDELPYFSAGDRAMTFPLGGAVLAPAICYESLQERHAREAKAAGATVYLASVAKAARGVDTAYRHYPAIARQHGLTVLMANGVGPADDFTMPGSSAAWSDDGDRVCNAGTDEEAIVVFDLATHRGEVVSFARPEAL